MRVFVFIFLLTLTHARAYENCLATKRQVGLFSESMERLLSVSRELRDKVQQNESAAGELLRQCEELREELKAMRQVSWKYL